MTSARWFIAASWLLLLWIFAMTVWVPAARHALTAAAQAVLETHAKKEYAVPVVSFDGQKAVLRGLVRTDNERRFLEEKIRHEVRTQSPWALGLDGGFNPVTEVDNQIQVLPFPSGWLLLVAQGPLARLSGAAATSLEARDVAARVRQEWAAEGGVLVADVRVDAGSFDESKEAERTLARVPEPRAAGGDSAQVQIARLGGDWQRLPLDAKDEFLREEVLRVGLSAQDWQEHVLPALRHARRHQEVEREREALALEQAKLPPPHVFLAARDRLILLRGEVARLGIKRELLNAIIATFPDWKVIDEVGVNPKRRSLADFGPITTALLPPVTAGTGKKSLALGLSGEGWSALDWQVGRDAQPWAERLPKDLPAALVAKDSAAVIEWLQGNPRGIPQLPRRAQPAFLTLTLLPDRAIIAGQVAEEALRSQLIDAARRAYGARAIVMPEGLLARGTVEPSADVQQTIRSLPALPEEKDGAIVAFARPGQVWKAEPATPATVEPGGIAKTALLPADFPAAMAEDTFYEAFYHVRALWKKPAVTGSSAPGKATP